MRNIHGEPSFHPSTPEVELHVAARAGHMAPDVFHLPDRDVSPYSLSPWKPGEFPDLPPLLDVLRGDFLCLPFGGQTHGPPHDDPANGETQALKPGAEFTHLTSVPLASGGTTDLTCYPARAGSDDLVMMASAPATLEQPFAWSAAVMDGCLWFSPHLVLDVQWRTHRATMEQQAPRQTRHRGCLLPFRKRRGPLAPAAALRHSNRAPFPPRRNHFPQSRAGRRCGSKGLRSDHIHPPPRGEFRCHHRRIRQGSHHPHRMGIRSLKRTQIPLSRLT